MERRQKPLERQLEAIWRAIDNGGGGSGQAGPKGDKGDKGDPGIQGPPGNDGAPGDDGQSGAQGIPGERGETGLKGDTGNDGNDGLPGNDGSDGSSAYEVAVANGYQGNEVQWLASLVGAKGDKGDTGNTGNTGSQGQPGTNGSDGNDGAPGDSAYQVAVSQGFGGNVAAWLASLVGPKGDTGSAGSDATVNNANVNSAITADRPATKMALALVKGDVGLGNVDNTADTAKPISTATQTALDGKQAAGSYAAGSHVGSGGSAHANAVASGAAGFLTGTDKAKIDGIASGATANSTDAALSAAYRTLLDSSGSHTAAKAAGTYGLGQGDPLAVSGTGTLYPLNVIYIDAADYPAIGALTAKLRVRCIIECNDVAPTGNFTVGLHAVTRPGTSGGAGLCIYSMASAIAGSTATQNTPAADSQNVITSGDFAVPATGYYVIGIVTTGTIATSAHVHISAALQMRYS